jgi:hypothetical protein
MKSYRKPRRNFIGRSKATEKLYRLEEKRSEIIKLCVEEYMKVTTSDSDPMAFWAIGMPQGLFDVLEAFDTEAAKLAAQSFLEMHGYNVEKKREDA